MIPPFPSLRLMCSFNRGNIEVTNSSKIRVFYVCKVIGFVD